MGLCEFRIAHVRVVAAAEMSALTVRNARMCTYRQVFVCVSVCGGLGRVSRAPMWLISGAHQMSLGCNEKASPVLMHNKVNGLLDYHSV